MKFHVHRLLFFSDTTTDMSTLARILLILGLLIALSVTSFILYYQFARQTSSFTKLTKDDLTEEWIIRRNDSTFMPLVTDINGQLIHVWFPDNGQTIRLESTASDCRYRLPDHKRIKRPLQAVGTSIGSVVVALFEEDLTDRRTNFRIYAFHERYECVLSIIDDIALDEAAYSSDAVFLLGEHYSFDVFLKNDRYCGPGNVCRRSYRSIRQVEPISRGNDSQLVVASEVWSIGSMVKNYFSSGFILLEIFLNDTISIRRLDSELKPSIGRYWSGIDHYSTSEGRISLCAEANSGMLICNLVDGNLKDLVDKGIEVPVDEDKRDLQLRNLPTGGVIVLWIAKAEHQVLYEKNTFVVKMRIVDADGEVSDVMKLLDHNVCAENEIRSLSSADGLCFRVACNSGVSVKCIVPDKDRLFQWV